MKGDLDVSENGVVKYVADRNFHHNHSTFKVLLFCKYTQNTSSLLSTKIQVLFHMGFSSTPSLATLNIP